MVGGVVGWGGLFDYSVYSWPSFNQEWNQAMVGPCLDQVRTMLGLGKDPDLDQELDNKTNFNFLVIVVSS